MDAWLVAFGVGAVTTVIGSLLTSLAVTRRRLDEARQEIRWYVQDEEGRREDRDRQLQVGLRRAYGGALLVDSYGNVAGRIDPPAQA